MHSAASPANNGPRLLEANAENPYRSDNFERDCRPKCGYQAGFARG